MDIENKDQENILSGVLSAGKKRASPDFSEEIPPAEPVANVGGKVEESILAKKGDGDPFSSVSNLDSLGDAMNEKMSILTEKFKITPLEDIKLPEESEEEIENRNAPDFLKNVLIKAQKREMYTSQPNFDEYQKEIKKLAELYGKNRTRILEKENSSNEGESTVVKKEKLETALKETPKPAPEEKVEKNIESTVAPDVEEKKSEPVVENKGPVTVEKKENAENLKTEEEKKENKKEGTLSFIGKNLKEGAEGTLGFSFDNFKNKIKGKSQEEMEEEAERDEDETTIENQPYILENSDFSNLDSMLGVTEEPLEETKPVKEEPIKLNPKNPEKSLLQQSIEANRTESELPSAAKAAESPLTDLQEFSPESNVKSSNTSREPVGKESYESLEKKMDEMVNIMREIRTALRSPLMMKNVDRTRDY